MFSSAAVCQAALVLLMDASSSMDQAAWRLQVEGHRAALASPAVTSRLEASPVAVVAYAFAGNVWEMAPWRILGSEADAKAFGASLTRAASYRDDMTYHGTATGDALQHATAAHQNAPCDPARRITDMVTDGPQNAGVPSQDARDEAEAAGITVNVLTVRTHADDDPAATARALIATTTGFVLEVEDWPAFAHAIARKITMELATR